MENNRDCVIFLHIHIPYVKHHDYDHSLYKGNYQETWYYEAVFESYLPLLYYIHQALVKREAGYIRFAINFSPTILIMMTSQYHQKGFLNYLENLESFYEKLQINMENQECWEKIIVDNPHMVQNLKKHHYDLYKTHTFFTKKLKQLKNFYCETLKQDIISFIRKLIQIDIIEVFGQPLTHPLLPLIPNDRSRHFQLKLGKELVKNILGYDPKGIWLPEAAYFPGLEDLLLKIGYQYTIVEPSVALNNEEYLGREYFLKTQNQFGFFMRSIQLTDAIWHKDTGYPSHADYREFYHDYGNYLKYSFLAEFLFDNTLDREHTFRHYMGLKHFRITDTTVRLEEKQPYNRRKGLLQVKKHSQDFIGKILSKGKSFNVLAFDTELFGHWWYEGPDFLMQFYKDIKSQPEINLVLPREYYKNNSQSCGILAEPTYTTWGKHGNLTTWVEKSNEHIWKYIYECEAILDSFIEKGLIHVKDKKIDLLLSELLLLEASDFPFILHSNSSQKYVNVRMKRHYERFKMLAEMIKDGDSNFKWAEKISNDDLFYPYFDLQDELLKLLPLYAKHPVIKNKLSVHSI